MVADIDELLFPDGMITTNTTLNPHAVKIDGICMIQVFP